jgi:DNA-binding response OmpR family regulator
MDFWSQSDPAMGAKAMMPKILVVEDSKEFQLMVKSALGREMQAEVCESLTEARKKVNSESYDLILLDIALPDGSGFDFCTELQRNERTQRLPIIFLTGRTATTDKVLGLTLGADDYVTKPFEPTELKARVESQLRKSSAKVQEESTIERGPLKLNLPNYTATIVVDGRETKLDLTPIEYKIIYRLAKNPGLILTRQQLIDNVWGVGAYIEDRSVDKHISSLRKKLGDCSNYVRTVSGLGYQFVTDLR